MTTASFANILVGAAVCFVQYGLWRASQPTPLFTVTLSEGIPRATFGAVTPEFLTRVTEVAAAHGVTRGTIRGLAHGERIRLQFSANIPEPARQQLRNWWATFGWRPPIERTRKRAS